MTTQEIKSFLHEKIEDIKDPDFLKTIKEILDDNNISYEDPKLEPWQLKRIENADASIDKGDFLTDEQARNIINEWLKR